LKDVVCLFIFYLVSHSPRPPLIVHFNLCAYSFPSMDSQAWTPKKHLAARTASTDCQVAFGKSGKKCPHCAMPGDTGVVRLTRPRRGRGAFFIELPIEHDLQHLFKGRARHPAFSRLLFYSFFSSLREDPEFAKGLEYMRTRTYTKGVLEDIQDGKAYQDLLRPDGFLRDHSWNLVLGSTRVFRRTSPLSSRCGYLSPGSISSSSPFILR